MGYKIFGIATSEAKDRDDETMVLKGVNVNNFNFLKDEHDDDSFSKIGIIRKAKKIFNKNDCEGWREKHCWESTKKPFLYFEAELLDDKKHPNAQAAAGLIDTLTREKIGNIRASIEGGLHTKKDNRLEKTTAESVVLTVQPVNKDCKVFPYNTLKKSDKKYPLNTIANIKLLKIKLKKSKQDDTEIYQDLEKSINLAIDIVNDYIQEYSKSLYTVQCKFCKSSATFSKIDTDETPNICMECGKHYKMEDFYKAINNKE